MLTIAFIMQLWFYMLCKRKIMFRNHMLKEEVLKTCKLVTVWEDIGELISVSSLDFKLFLD